MCYYPRATYVLSSMLASKSPLSTDLVAQKSSAYLDGYTGYVRCIAVIWQILDAPGTHTRSPRALKVTRPALQISEMTTPDLFLVSSFTDTAGAARFQCCHYLCPLYETKLHRSRIS